MELHSIYIRQQRMLADTLARIPELVAAFDPGDTPATADQYSTLMSALCHAHKLSRGVPDLDYCSDQQLSNLSSAHIVVLAEAVRFGRATGYERDDWTPLAEQVSDDSAKVAIIEDSEHWGYHAFLRAAQALESDASLLGQQPTRATSHAVLGRGVNRLVSWIVVRVVFLNMLRT
jgi:hypothetical protein